MPSGQRLVQLAVEAAGAPTPEAALRKLRALRRELDTFERSQVADALAEGASFASVARDLGLSRQAVHRRFRSLSDAEPSRTPEAQRVLRYAREEAAAVGASEVSGEHVLLAVLRAGDVPAAILLRAAGLTLERTRTQIQAAAPRERLFKRDDLSTGELHTLLTTSARRPTAGSGAQVDVEDLLLQALEESTGGASETLRAFGVDPDVIRSHLRTLLGTDASPGREGRAKGERGEPSGHE